MKTLLVGNFGAKNIGDELILLAALEDYPHATVMTTDSDWTQAFCERKFKTVSFPPTGLRSYGRYVLSKSYRQELKILKSFDKIVFAGGGLFAIKWRACLLWWLVFKWLKGANSKAEFRFECQGVDSGLGCFSNVLTGSVLRSADYVSVRENASLAQVEKLKVSAELKADRFWASGFLPVLEAEKQTKILVNAVAAITKPLLARLVSSYGAENLVFVAFAPPDLKQMPQDWPGAVVFPKTKTALLNLFAEADGLVAERLHALFFGSKVGVKRIKLLRQPYSEKVAVFAEKLSWKKF